MNTAVFLCQNPKGKLDCNLRSKNSDCQKLGSEKTNTQKGLQTYPMINLILLG